MKFPLSSSHRAAFTLIEVLTTVAILAILLALVFPYFSQSAKRARAMQGANNLRSIGTALHTYTTQNNGSFPRVTIKKSESGLSGDITWTKAIGDYLPQLGNSATSREHKVFVCPNAEYMAGNGSVYTIDQISRTYSCTEAMYGIRFLSSGSYYDSKKARRLSTIQQPARTILVIDAKQSGTAAGCFSATVWSRASQDIVLEDIGESVYLDFRQPSETMHALFVDGHVEAMSLLNLKEMLPEQWHGRDEY